MSMIWILLGLYKHAWQFLLHLPCGFRESCHESWLCRYWWVSMYSRMCLECSFFSPDWHFLGADCLLVSITVALTLSVTTRLVFISLENDSFKCRWMVNMFVKCQMTKRNATLMKNADLCNFRWFELLRQKGFCQHHHYFQVGSFHCDNSNCRPGYANWRPYTGYYSITFYCKK